MNAFQQRLLTLIEMRPGINRKEIALALGLKYINGNDGKHLRHLEDRGAIVSKFVCDDSGRRVKVYRVR